MDSQTVTDFKEGLTGQQFTLSIAQISEVDKLEWRNKMHYLLSHFMIIC